MTAAPERGTVTVRRAELADAAAIREVAHDAWRATYHDLIGAEPVERFLAQAYTPERVALRIERHETYVAAVSGGDRSGVDAFVEAMRRGRSRAHRRVLHATGRPRAGDRQRAARLRRDGVPGLDLSADVLVGNELGEPFYVARGFEPGDLLEEEIGGETIRERRWWLRA